MRLAPLFAVLAVAATTGCKDSSATSAQPTASAAAAAPSADEPKDVSLPGIDTSAMTPRERREFSRLATQLFAPCPSVPVSVATCVLDKRACGTCGQAAKFIAHAVRAGVPTSDIEHAYKGGPLRSLDDQDPAALGLPLQAAPTRRP